MSKSSKRRVKHTTSNKPVPVADVLAVEKAEEELLAAKQDFDPDYEFISVDEFEVGVADERQLKLLMQDWRKGRATRTIWEAITDGYVTVFSLVVVAAMVISGLLSVQRSAAGCTNLGCTTSREMLPWLFWAAFTLAALAVARLFGPVVASAAEGFWLLDAPLRRAKLLRGRLVGVVILAFVLAAGLTVGMLLFTGLAWTTIFVWAFAVGGSAAAAVAFAAVMQASEQYKILRAVQSLFGLGSLAILVMMVGIRLGWWPSLTNNSQVGQAGHFLLLGAAVVFVLAFIFALRGLHMMRRARLLSGGSLIAGMQGAMFALDFGLMRDILDQRHWYEKGWVRPSKGRGLWRTALVWRDFERLIRNPGRLLLLAVSVVFPYALLALGLGRLAWPLSAIGLMTCLVPCFSSLRVLSRTKGLARCFPLSTSQLNSALTLVPAVLAALWAMATSPAYLVMNREAITPDAITYSFMCALITAMAGYVGAIRWVAAKPPDFSTPMVATGVGALPPGLAFNLIRGFDVIAIICLPLLLGWSYWISLVIALICYVILRAGLPSQEELLARNEEARKELAAMKDAKESGGEKRVYQRKSR